MAGYLSAPEVAFTCSPLNVFHNAIMDEMVPKPVNNERVCFVPFLIRGWVFPFITSSEVFSNLTSCNFTTSPQTRSFTLRALSCFVKLFSVASRT